MLERLKKCIRKLYSKVKKAKKSIAIAVTAIVVTAAVVSAVSYTPDDYSTSEMVSVANHYEFTQIDDIQLESASRLIIGPEAEKGLPKGKGPPPTTSNLLLTSVIVILVFLGISFYFRRKEITQYLKRHKKKMIAIAVGGALLGGGVALVPMPSPPEAEVSYYVSNTGDDSNAGTSEVTPWKTIGKVNSELDGGVINAGDDIYFKRGDIFTDAYLILKNGGASYSNPMIIGAYGSGARPIIDNNNGTYGIVSDSSNSNDNNITIQDIHINHTQRWINFLDASENITINNCYFSNATSSDGIRFKDIGGGVTKVPNYYIKFTNNTVYNGEQDIIVIRTVHYGLIENNIFHGGDRQDHGMIQMLAGVDDGYENNTHIVIRNNTFFDAPVGRHFVNFNRGANYCLFENNILYDLDDPDGVSATIWNTDMSQNNIMRYNIMYNCTKAGFYIWTDSHSIDDVANNTFYHNTVYKCGNDFDSRDACISIDLYDSMPDACEVQDNIFKNNILHTGDRYIVSLTTETASLGENVIDNLWDNNIMYNPGTDYVYWNGTEYDLSEIETAFPSYFQNNLQSDPKLVDVENGNFTLQSDSPAIDVGAWLTQTDGTGTNTPWITVDEANYFFAGISELNVAGDNVFVGDDTNLEIIEINYDNNSFKVNRSISWDDNENVSLSDYSGSAPDIGAKELTQYSTTIRNDGEDYFIWMGINTTASVVDNYISGFDEVSEYIAIWNLVAWDSTHGLWNKWYGDGSGTDWSINTFDVIEISLSDTGTQTITMIPNTDMSYTASRSVAITKTDANKGYNYTGYTLTGISTLWDAANNTDMATGELIAWWDGTNYIWNAWIIGFSNNNPSAYNKDVSQYDVFLTVVGSTRTFTID